MSAGAGLKALAHTGRALPSASVPALWGLYNGCWLVVLAAMGGSAVDLYLYGGAVALIELFGGWIVLWGRLFPLQEKGTSPIPIRNDLAILGATAVLFAGMAPVFGMWFLPMLGATVVLFVIVLRGKQGFRSHHRAVRRLD